MSKRAEEFAVRIHNTALRKAEKYASEHGMSVLEEVSYGRGFKAGAITVYEQAEKDLGWHLSTEHPPVDEEVIVLLGRYEDFPQIAFGHIVDQNIAIDYNGWNIPGVMYWMPTPKIPKEEEK